MAEDLIGQNATADKPKLVINYRSIGDIPPRKDPPVRGVYVIRCRPSDSLYVGSSIHIRRRLSKHVSELRAGEHHSRYLQAAWTSLGEAEFDFAILEVVPSAEPLIPREVWFFHLLSPKYNSVVPGMMIQSDARFKRVRTAESRARISKILKDGFASGRLKSSCLRPVEMGGRIFPSVKAAADFYGLTWQGTIKRIHAGQGRYVDRPDMPAPAPTPNAVGVDLPGARVICIDGQRFGSITTAAKHFGLNRSSLGHWLYTGKATYADGKPVPSKNKRYSV